jgi:AmmeMemoRadiSam system protein A
MMTSGTSELSGDARAKLLWIARAAVAAAIRGEPPPALGPETTAGALARPAGCFVTLKTRGDLRGCLGHFEADAPLAERVREMAAAAATEDPRFWTTRLRPEELEELEIEISVLSPLERVDDPLSIEMGRDGIYVRREGRSGCYLPQFATETGWSKEEFLSSCCAHKARLPADAWKDPATEVFRFRAEIFEAGPDGG